jgi:hypothetical protein
MISFRTAAPRPMFVRSSARQSFGRALPSLHWSEKEKRSPVKRKARPPGAGVITSFCIGSVE